jgi:uncharacterized membrane protein
VSNPHLALWLYVAILAMAFMFSPRWGNLTGALSTGIKAKQGA